MEKQSTSKFLRSVIAVVALFMLVVSGVLLASCKEEHVHTEPNNYGACTDCGSIIDWDKFGSQMSTLLDPSFDELTASLTDLASEVTEVKGDVDSIIDALNVAGDGSDIDTIVQNVQAVLDQITALIGAENVAARSTPATITGIASAITGVQQTLNMIGAGNIEHVCENHQFDTETPIVEIAPSCERAGAVVYRCSNCNATIALPVNQLEHVAADEPVKENVVAPTCGVAGSHDEVYYCKYGCGTVVERVPVVDAALEHNYQVTDSTASCTDAGEITYTCTNCGDSYTETGTILPHSYDWTVSVSEVAPKCEVEGSATYKCANCETTVTLTPSDEKPESMSEELWTAFVGKYSALEHSYDTTKWVYTDEISYNVLESGTYIDQITQMQYEVCSVCGNEKVVMEEDGVTPVTRVTNHKLVVEDRTFENKNIKKYADLEEDHDLLVKYGFVAAEEGGKAVNADKISKSGYVNISCSQTATIYFVCADTNCDIKHTEEADNAIEIVLPALTHVWVDDEVTKPATCTEDGIMSTKCSICETAGDPRVILQTGHNLVLDEENSKPATCTENGVEIKKCTNAGCTYTEETVLPAGHKWVDVEGSEEITWTLGDVTGHYVSITQECSVCGATQKTEPELESHSERFYDAEEVRGTELEQELYELYGVRIVEHATYGYVFTTAACDDPGPVVNVCVCGYIETVPYTNVTSQQHSYIVTDIPADDPCTGIAIRHKVCKWCGAEVDIPLGDPAGHTWVVVAAQDPTCDTNGWEGFAYCKECGKVVMFEATEDESAPDKMAMGYVEGVTCDGTEEDIEAVKDLEGIAIDALGHLWSSEPKVFLEVGCLSPVWEVTYCVRCFNYDADGDFTIKANGAEYPESAEGYVDTDFGAATDEFIQKLLDTLNWAGSDDVPPVSFTKEQLLSDEFNGHYNITGIKFVAAKGHTLNETQSDEKTDAIVCLTDKALDSYDDAFAFAQKVYVSVDVDKFKAAFDEIFGTNDTTRGGFVIDVNGDDAPTLAGICTECGMPIAVTEHDEEYYMFMITNGVNGAAYVPGEEIDYNTAHVHADDPKTTTVDEARYYVVDKDGVLRVNPDGTPIGMSNAEIAAQSVYSKAVYTYEEVKAWGFTNDNGSVNCYFEGFCANGCGTDMGHKAQHTFPTSDNYDKYHNCKHGDICVWCSNVLALSDDHNLQDLEEIAASDNKEYADAAKALYNSGYAWVGKDTENATCKDPAEDWTITVCVSCLLDWYKDGASDPDVWTLFDTNDPESEGNYTSVRKLTTGKHNYVEKSVGDRENPSCLVGFAAWYECTVCDEKLTYEEQIAADAPDYIKELKRLNEDDYIADGYSPAKPHTVAPVFNYFENSNYKPATDTTSAYMNFICVDCGFPLQGYYDNGVAEDGKLQYTMATDKQISDYNAKFDKPQVQVVRPVDKAAVTTIEFAAGATEDQKEAAVAKAIKDAEAEGATSVYLTISGDFTIGASDTTGENTVWQAYGITFSADSSVKKIVFDLGDNKLTFGEAASYKVMGEGTVVFSNGSIEANEVDAGSFFLWGYQSEIVLNGIEGVVTSGVIGFGSDNEPKTALGSVVIIDSTIESSGYFGFSTNAKDWQNSKVDVTIENSTITVSTVDGDNCAVMMNVPGTFTVKGSTIEADRQGIILRGGEINASIENTTINLSGKYESKDKYLTEAWGSGNEVPMGGIVLGDNNSTYTPGLATVALNKVTVNVEAEKVAKVYVYAKADDVQVDLTITNADAAEPTLAADDITANVTEANDGVYKLTVDGKVEINNDL